MATLTELEAGHCVHPGCVAVRGGPWRNCRFPSRAWLIESRGTRWLWDTGYASHFIDHTRAGLFAWYRRLTPVSFDPAQAVARQLSAHGLAPRALSGVVLSHFHADHVAGLRDFPGVPLLASGAGWAIARRWRGIAALRRAVVPGLFPEDIDTRLRAVESLERVALPAALAPFAHGHALPGTGGEVVLVALPGHAVGHLGAFVLGDAGWTLIASDAAWSPAGYTERRGPSRLAHLVMEDISAYHGTLDRLHTLHRGGGARIVLTHEGAL